MHGGGTLLGIDYGTATTTAVLSTPDGRRVPVMVDGASSVASGVLVDPDSGALLGGVAAERRAVLRPDCYLPDPKRQLHDGAQMVALGGRQVQLSEAAAVTFALVANEALRVTGGEPLSGLVVAVPPGWGPKRREIIRAAASRADLPDPTLVADPVAVALSLAVTTAPPLTVGGCVVIADAGASAMTLTVVTHAADAVQVLATCRVPDAAGTKVEDALTAHIGAAVAEQDPAWWERLSHPMRIEDRRDRHALRQAVNAAKHALASTERTVIPLPGPHLPAVVDRTDLAAITAAWRDDLPATVGQLLAAADIDRAHLIAVILTGGGALLPGLADAIAEATGISPLVPDRRDLAVADGLLQTAAGSGPTTTPANAQAVPAGAVVPASLPVASPPPTLGVETETGLIADIVRRAVPAGVANAVSLILGAATPPILAGASLLLLLQGLATADVLYSGGSLVYARVSTVQLAVASVLAVLACWATAHLFTYLSGAAFQPGTATRYTRLAYLAGGGFGLGTVVLYGLFTGLYFGGPPENKWLPQILAWATPTAIGAITVGLLAPRIPATRRSIWLRQMRPPLAGILPAVLGIVLLRAAGTLTAPADVLGEELPARLGALLLGLGVALTALRHPLMRIIAAPALALAYPLVFTWSNVRYMIITYLCAGTFWALTATINTARAAYTHALPPLRGLLDTTPSPPPTLR